MATSSPKDAKAWDAVFGTVTLGKFFLGFGSIGHVRGMPFNEAAVAYPRTAGCFTASPSSTCRTSAPRWGKHFARLTAMKLLRLPGLDYVHAARDDDRRYLLFNAVQKARVSTDGVQVMEAQLSECVAAMGFESSTYSRDGVTRHANIIPKLAGKRLHQSRLDRSV